MICPSEAYFSDGTLWLFNLSSPTSGAQEKHGRIIYLKKKACIFQRACTRTTATILRQDTRFIKRARRRAMSRRADTFGAACRSAAAVTANRLLLSSESSRFGKEEKSDEDPPTTAQRASFQSLRLLPGMASYRREAWDEGLLEMGRRGGPRTQTDRRRSRTSSTPSFCFPSAFIASHLHFLHSRCTPPNTVVEYTSC